MIPRVAKAGYQNLICFSGNRRGLSEEDGLSKQARALQPMVKLAEEHGVVYRWNCLTVSLTIQIIWQIRHSWGIKLAKELASPSFKLLYDIYHMQIMEGNLIQNIQENHNFYGHYHVAGVPGRNEPWNNQEINYPAVMQAIDKVGFDGLCSALEYVFAEPIKESMKTSYNEYIK